MLKQWFGVSCQIIKNQMARSYGMTDEKTFGELVEVAFDIN